MEQQVKLSGSQWTQRKHLLTPGLHSAVYSTALLTGRYLTPVHVHGEVLHGAETALSTVHSVKTVEQSSSSGEAAHAHTLRDDKAAIFKIVGNFLLNQRDNKKFRPRPDGAHF